MPTWEDIVTDPRYLAADLPTRARYKENFKSQFPSEPVPEDIPEDKPESKILTFLKKLAGWEDQSNKGKSEVPQYKNGQIIPAETQPEGLQHAFNPITDIAIGGIGGAGAEELLANIVRPVVKKIVGGALTGTAGMLPMTVSDVATGSSTPKEAILNTLMGAGMGAAGGLAQGTLSKLVEAIKPQEVRTGPDIQALTRSMSPSTEIPIPTKTQEPIIKTIPEALIPKEPIKQVKNTFEPTTLKGAIMQSGGLSRDGLEAAGYGLKDKTHRDIVSGLIRKDGQSPDVIAEDLANNGLIGPIPEGTHPSEYLMSLIQHEKETGRSQLMGFEDSYFGPEKQATSEKIPHGSISIGDDFKINGKRYIVRDKTSNQLKIDPVNKEEEAFWTDRDSGIGIDGGTFRHEYNFHREQNRLLDSLE